MSLWISLQEKREYFIYTYIFKNNSLRKALSYFEVELISNDAT